MGKVKKMMSCVIDGIRYHDGEKVAVRYKKLNWAEATLEYHHISRVHGFGRGWFILDHTGKAWPARLMDGIRKL